MPGEPTPQQKPGRRQMRLSDVAPQLPVRHAARNNVRGGSPGLFVVCARPELPADVRDAVGRTIAGLCRKSPGARAADVYDERLDDGRSTVPGWIVPLADWEHAMRQPLAGCHVSDTGMPKD